MGSGLVEDSKADTGTLQDDDSNTAVQRRTTRDSDTRGFVAAVTMMKRCRRPETFRRRPTMLKLILRHINHENP